MPSPQPPIAVFLSSLRSASLLIILGCSLLHDPITWYRYIQIIVVAVLQQLSKWLESPYIQAEILAMVSIMLQYLQFIFCRLRRRTNHWCVQCGSWVAYYVPMPLAACAIGMMLHLRYPFWLSAVFFSVGHADTMAAYSLTGDSQGLRRFLQRAFSIAFLARFIFTFFGALSFRSRFTHLLMEIAPLMLGFLVFFLGLQLHSRAIPSSVLAKITVDRSEKGQRFPESVSNRVTVDRTHKWLGFNFVTSVGSLKSYKSAVTGCTTLEDIGMIGLYDLGLERVNHMCLSSSLFHLLVQHFEFSSSAKGNLQKIRQVIADELISYQVHKIAELQLSFLYEYFFVAHSSSSGNYHSLYLRYSFVKICFLFSLLMSVHSFGVAIEVIHTSSSTICLVALVILEICQAASIFTSDWFIVSCTSDIAAMCTGSDSSEDTSISQCWMTKYLGMYKSSCELFEKRHWQNKLGQYSVIEDFDCNSMKQKLMGLVGRPQRGTRSCPVALSDEVIARSYWKIKSINSGGSSQRTQVQNDVLWACTQPTEIHTILIWHIATWYCMETSDDAVPDVNDRAIADELSKYCAYLVAFHPDLLRGQPIETTEIFDNLVHETELSLGDDTPSIPKEDRYLKMSNYLRSEATIPGCQGILRSGIKLGEHLLETRSSAGRWDLMADFWVEMIVFVAQSNNAEAHIDRLAKGGEFITHLWAVLSAAGIQQGSNKYFRDLLRCNKKYLEVPVPHATKSFPIVGSKNTHPAQLDLTIEKDLVSRGTDISS